MNVFKLGRTVSAMGLASALALNVAAGCASGGEGDDSSGGSGGRTDSGTDSGGSTSTGGVGGTGGVGASGGTGGAAGSAASGGASGAGATDAGSDADADADSDADTDAGDAGDGGDAAPDAPDCTLNVEICNGLDDNCNGAIDESVVGVGGACDVANKQGECKVGQLVCSSGSLICQQLNQPAPEACDGLDNNCNGAVDENNPGGGVPCNTSQQGVCAAGTARCDTAAGAIVCDQNIQSSPEVCNGADDDCDGQVDDGFQGAGDPCTVSGKVGPCAAGQTTCSVAGQSDCAQTVFPVNETCNGIDDDCDGTLDNPTQLDGSPCTTGALGACATGKTHCTGTTLECVPDHTSSLETCNGIDDDCNGVVDDVANIGLECSTKNPGGAHVSDWSCVSGFCAISGCDTGFLNCDGAPGDGCEIGILTDANNCSACGAACNSTHGVGVCIGGACDIGCDSGWGNCDSDASNGCESNLNTTTATCGTCGTSCSNAHGNTSCVAGTCTPSCQGTYGNCDSDPINGCETNTDSTTAHCGGCASPCVNPNGTTSCSGGACQPVCDAGSANCDGNAKNGCETDTNTTTNRCGACSIQCINANGTTSCSGGTCVPQCASGSGDCDGNPINGCETNTNGSTGNCGACGIQCSNSNGTTACVGGACQPSCAANYQDCDGFKNNGCESNRQTDVANCGACDNVCFNDNGSTSCVAGLCTPVCDPGFRNCDSNRNNGCETDITTSTSNCGGCGQVCATTNATGTQCVPNGASGSCVPACASGFGNCDGIGSNGCETNTNIDVNHCGNCATVCSGVGASCSGGICQANCTVGSANCDGNAGNGCETNTTNDKNNCGGCGIKCDESHGTAACVNSVCVPSCPGPDWFNCDGVGLNGCETNIKSDTGNCGGCGAAFACSNGHGSTQCIAGTCLPSCSPISSWGDCDGNARNGCESDLLGSTTHCGSCTTQCTAQNGANDCVSGLCSPSCASGFKDCSNPNNGCETNTNTDVLNCGNCGAACNTTNAQSTSCSSGNCQFTCSAGWARCGANTYCQTNTTSDSSNCGSCGNACTTGGTVTGANCQSSTCKVTACQSGRWDGDGGYANGCECVEDTVSDICASATAISVGVSGSGSASGTIGQSTGDVDWYHVTINTAGAGCGFVPKIQLTGKPLTGSDVVMNIFSTCGGAGYACQDLASTTLDQTVWQFTNTATCGDNQGADPSPANGYFLKFLAGAPPPTTWDFWIRVKAGSGSSSCRPYSLSITTT